MGATFQNISRKWFQGLVSGFVSYLIVESDEILLLGPLSLVSDCYQTVGSVKGDGILFYDTVSKTKYKKTVLKK